MNKITKTQIIFWTIISLFLFPFFLLLANCNNDTENKKFDFIFQRTIMLETKSAGAAGGQFTGWLFEKTNEPYTYYLATCEHCRLGVESQCELHSDIEMWYGSANDAKEGSNIDISTQENNSYTHFLCTLDNNLYFEWIYEPNYYQDYISDEITEQWGVDVAIAKINFSNAIDNDLFLKNRLNNLNNYANKHNNKLIEFSKNNVNINQKLYIGGYPANSEFLPHENINHWRTAISNISYIKENFDRNSWPYEEDTKPTDDNNLDCNLRIRHYKSMADAYYTPQIYWCDNPCKYFGAGASGSLVINDNYEVMGIFRGDVKGDLRNGFPSYYQLWIDCLYVENLYDIYTEFKSTI